MQYQALIHHIPDMGLFPELGAFDFCRLLDIAILDRLSALEKNRVHGRSHAHPCQK